MMEFNNFENTLNGGLFNSYNNDQGFQFGAKTNTYSPSYSFVKNEAENNWLESNDLFGEEFNAFENVILPNEVTFSPDDLLNDLDLNDSAINNDSLVSNLQPLDSVNDFNNKETIKEIEYEIDGNDIIISADQIDSAVTIPENQFQSNTIPINEIETQPILFLDSNGEISFEPATSSIFGEPNNDFTFNLNVEEPVQNNITINLKTVKLPNKSLHQKKKVTKINEFPLSSTSKVIKKAESPKHSSITAPSSPLSKMTLKEALENGCADDILNELLEMVSPSAPAGTCSRLLDEVTACVGEPSTSFLSDSDLTSGGESPLTSGSETGFSPVYDPSFSPMDMTSFPEDSDSDFHMPENEPKKKGRRPKLTPEEKKLKKMEQNKRAATRYRQKKKREEGEVHERLRQEEERHKNLTGQYKQLKQEIKVMKKMMRELFIAKGIVSAEDFNK